MFYTASIVLLVLSFLLFTVAVVLALVWKIHLVYAELSGRENRKQVKKLRNINRANLEGISTSDMQFEGMGGGSDDINEVLDDIPDPENSEDNSLFGRIIRRSSGEVERVPSQIEDVSTQPMPTVTNVDVIEKEDKEDTAPREIDYNSQIAYDYEGDDGVDESTGMFDEESDRFGYREEIPAFSPMRQVRVVFERGSI